MKKKITIFIILCLITFGGYKALKLIITSGDDYYVQVTTDGQRYEKKINNKMFIQYNYKLNGYNDKGEKQVLSFSPVGDYPFKKHTFLKVTYNKKKGVITYEEVIKQKVPKKALEKINQ